MFESLLALAGDGLGIVSAVMRILERMFRKDPETPTVQLNLWHQDGYPRMWGEVINNGRTSLVIKEYRLIRPWTGGLVRLYGGNPKSEPTRRHRVGFMIGPGQSQSFDLRIDPARTVRSVVLLAVLEQQDPTPRTHKIRVWRKPRH